MKLKSSSLKMINKIGWRTARMVECLPSKYKALRSSPSTERKKQAQQTKVINKSLARLFEKNK
jgi:hypothetical protein